MAIRIKMIPAGFAIVTNLRFSIFADGKLPGIADTEDGGTVGIFSVIAKILGGVKIIKGCLQVTTLLRTRIRDTRRKRFGK
jgi:hypothetical protein